eukprot:5334418-Pyramimonas_sp.AAC.1
MLRAREEMRQVEVAAEGDVAANTRAAELEAARMMKSREAERGTPDPAAPDRSRLGKNCGRQVGDPSERGGG